MASPTRAGTLEQTRICRACHQTKLICEFRVRPDKPHLHRHQCLPCERFYKARWKAENPEAASSYKGTLEYKESQRRYMRRLRMEDPEKYRRLSRSYNLKSDYGITLEDYELIYSAQGGKCAICEESGKAYDATITGRGNVPGILVVDHDHKTGKIRELLCSRCNNALGWFKDDPVFLLKAVAYLRKHSGE